MPLTSKRRQVRHVGLPSPKRQSTCRRRCWGALGLGTCRRPDGRPACRRGHQPAWRTNASNATARLLRPQRRSTLVPTHSNRHRVLSFSNLDAHGRHPDVAHLAVPRPSTPSCHVRPDHSRSEMANITGSARELWPEASGTPAIRPMMKRTRSSTQRGGDGIQPSGRRAAPPGQFWRSNFCDSPSLTQSHSLARAHGRSTSPGICLRCGGSRATGRGPLDSRALTRVT
jgi:hypothetical protein